MTRFLRATALAFALSTLAGCSVVDSACASRQSADAQTDGDAQSSSVSDDRTAPRGPFKIVFLGDSLTAGIGLRLEDSFPTLVQQRFLAEGYQSVEVVNAALNAQTTAGGVQRLAEVLEPDLKILVVALGSSDALRGIATAQTRENLVAIIEAARDRGVSVLLAGMDPPGDLGQDYQLAFRSIFIQLANEYKGLIVYMPSLLEGVAGNPLLNQPDGLRPNPDGARTIAANVYGRLQVMVDQMGGGG